MLACLCSRAVRCRAGGGRERETWGEVRKREEGDERVGVGERDVVMVVPREDLARSIGSPKSVWPPRPLGFRWSASPMLLEVPGRQEHRYPARDIGVQSDKQRWCLVRRLDLRLAGETAPRPLGRPPAQGTKHPEVR